MKFTDDIGDLNRLQPKNPEVQLEIILLLLPLDVQGHLINCYNVSGGCEEKLLTH